MATGETLSRREAAEYLGVHYNTVRHLEQKGLLTGKRVTVNGVEEIRIPVTQLEEVRKDREIEPGATRSPRPQGVAGNPEASRIWRAYEQLEAEVLELRERTARLEADNAQLASRLEAAEAERVRLLEVVLKATERG